MTIDRAIAAAQAKSVEKRVEQRVAISSTSTPEHPRIVAINAPADLTDAELLEFTAWLTGPFANALREQREKGATSRILVPSGVLG